MKPSVIIGVLLVRYVLLPAIGIWVVKAAATLGFLPSDPLYRFVLMVQFTLPPAMNIGKQLSQYAVSNNFTESSYAIISFFIFKLYVLSFLYPRSSDFLTLNLLQN